MARTAAGRLDLPMTGGTRARDPFAVDKGRPVNAWQTASGRDIRDEIAIGHLAVEWGEIYRVTSGEDDYRARCWTGGATLVASTPAGLESAIRADWARRSAR